MEFAQTRVILGQYGNEVIKSNGKSATSSSCIPQDCQNFIVDYNCTCAAQIVNYTTCHDHVISDQAIPTVLWSISAFILLLFVSELILIRFGHSFMNSVFGKLVFLMGIASSIVTQFCTMPYLQENNQNITVWYNICLGGVSIFFLIFGFQFLFEKSETDNIGSHDRGMGLVVAIISLFLVGLEVVLIVMVFRRENLSTAFALYLLVFALQKIIQVVVYIRIRRCKPFSQDEKLQKGAVFYLNFLSYLNFTLWLNSIPFTDIQIYDKVSHGDILKYVDETFKALVIDYRLLCALLFLEHSLAIDDEEDQQDDQYHYRAFQIERKHYCYTVFGVGIGLVLLAFESLNAAQFWNEGFPLVVNLFPIMSDLILVLLGVMLLRNVHTSVLHGKKISFVFLMVLSMGVVSIIYFFCFGLLSFSSFKHDKPISYVQWSGWVFIFRGSSMLIFLLVYTGVTVHTMDFMQNLKTKNFLFVSALCCGLFARFIGSILDEFGGIMHKIAHKHLETKKLRALQDLFVIGPLFHLAATLHLALHFLLLVCRLFEKREVIVDDENVQRNVIAEDENVQRNVTVEDENVQRNVTVEDENVQRNVTVEDENVQSNGDVDENTPLLSRTI
ncbi:uncharacterized protein LOC114521866 [Dendronephthya gigantea]|uniref:uncharacterized protein LOC114521866 n=1 Tax=Dendronephthya gigantea TaxID=151771 RepID=UPI0010697538|nr:uncharacterized protein LOC114521866 [Dendronephthya gigantea]